MTGFVAPVGKRSRSSFSRTLIFQVAPGHLSGLRVARADGSVKGGFVLPFRERPVAPSFDRTNVTYPAALEVAIAKGQRNLRLSSGTVALLIPEPSVRVFVLSVDEFPRSGKEREAFLRWRISRQMPLIPEDARIAYSATPGRGARKVIAAMARQVVIWEYEALFEKAGLKPVVVSAPTLALVNLVRGEAAGNAILLNLEDETLTLLALANGGWTLYRQKDIGPAAGGDAEERIDNIVREAENTVRFLEDKEGTATERLWVRSAAEGEVPEVARRIEDRTGLPVRTVDYEAPRVWTAAHKAVLAPLIGQVQ